MGDGSNLCARLHHRMLHGTKVTYVNCARGRVAVYQGAKEVPVEAEVMLHMIYMQFPNHIRTVMFFKDGSSFSLNSWE